MVVFECYCHPQGITNKTLFIFFILISRFIVSDILIVNVRGCNRIFFMLWNTDCSRLFSISRPGKLCKWARHICSCTLHSNVIVCMITVNAIMNLNSLQGLMENGKKLQRFCQLKGNKSTTLRIY